MQVSANNVTVKAVHNSGSNCFSCIFNKSALVGKGCALVAPVTDLQKAVKQAEKDNGQNCLNYIWIEVQ